VVGPLDAMVSNIGHGFDRLGVEGACVEGGLLHDGLRHALQGAQPLLRE